MLNTLAHLRFTMNSIKYLIYIIYLICIITNSKTSVGQIKFYK